MPGRRARERVQPRTVSAELTCVRAFPSRYLSHEPRSCQPDLRVRLMRDGALLDDGAQRLTVSANLRELSAMPVQLYEVASIRISPSTITGFQ